MKKLTGCLVISSILLILAVGVFYLAAPYALKFYNEQNMENASDFQDLKRKITVAGDPWLGYFIARTPYFRKLLAKHDVGLIYKTVDNFEKRFAGLGSKYDIVFGTIDSYIKNGKKSGYKGVTIFAIDESNGGDGVVAHKKIKNIDLLNDPDIKIGFVPNSPSDYLLKVIISNFDLTFLVGEKKWQRPAGNIKQVYKNFMRSKTDVAILWEPQLSQALKEIPGAHLITSTKETDDLIIDVAIASRKCVAKNKSLIQAFMKAYFDTLRYYKTRPDKLLEQVMADGQLTKQEATKSLKGIELIDYADNCIHWFGIGNSSQAASSEKVSRVINNTIQVLIDNKVFNKSPLDNPFQIINSHFLKFQSRLKKKRISRSQFKVKYRKASNVKEVTFQKLGNSYKEWERQTVKVGTLKVEPIYFKSGQAGLTLEGKESVDKMASKLSRFPSYRVIIKGHSSPGSDPEVALELSRKRANSINRYLLRTWKFNKSRILSKGFGTTHLLERLPNESKRAWKTRNQRVEFVLVKDS